MPSSSWGSTRTRTSNFSGSIEAVLMTLPEAVVVVFVPTWAEALSVKLYDLICAPEAVVPL